MASASPRPAFVRLIVAYYGFLYVLVALGAFWLASAWGQLPESTTSALRNIPPLQWGVVALIAGLNLVGTIQLFRMRRHAFYCYVAALTLATTYPICAVLKGASLGVTLRSFSGAGYSLGIAVSLYTWHLLKSGELE